MVSRWLCFKPFISSSTTRKSTKPDIDSEDIFDRLPNDVVVEILSRLPTGSVVRCRRVCKRWLALTLSSRFTEIHLEKALPQALVQSFNYAERSKDLLNLFLLRKSFVSEDTVVINRVCCEFLGASWPRDRSPVIMGSCNGLLALKSRLSETRIICNPVTREHIIIPQPMTTLPNKRLWSSSFFYHPSAKEYKFLLSYRNSSGTGNNANILIFGLKSGGGGLWRELGVVPYPPSGSGRLAVKNNSVLSMVWSLGYEDENEIPPCRSSIVTFNMTSEEFGYMPHPGGECTSRRRHDHAVLGEWEGKVILFWHSPFQIDIWVLEDYDNWSWSKSYKVDLKRLLHISSSSDLHVSNAFLNGTLPAALPLCFGRGELYLVGVLGGLYRYNLKENILRKIDVSMMMPPGKRINLEDFEKDQTYGSLAYTPSFVSLREFQTS